MESEGKYLLSEMEFVNSFSKCNFRNTMTSLCSIFPERKPCCNCCLGLIAVLPSTLY